MPLSKQDFRPIIEARLGTKFRCSTFKQRSGNNDYSKLAPYSNKPGIYHFTDERGNSLYIGTSGYGRQGIKERATQHLTAGDTGGTFKNRVANDLFKEEADPLEAKARAAAWILDNTLLQLVVTPDEEHYELEQLAIDIFRPKYNPRTEKRKPAEPQADTTSESES